MALIKCPDCGKMVSDRAQNCPDCGFPIQEEVQRLNDITNIEGNDASGEYSNLTEKEVAKKLCEAISKRQFADINVFQSILKNKFAEGYYAKIVEDSRDFSDDEAEKNQYIVKNVELIIDYLDYPLDAMGIRNWFIDKEDRKGKGFFQSDADSFDDFSKYYVNNTVCDVIDLKEVMRDLLSSSPLISRCIVATKSRYAVVLSSNIQDYKRLIDRSKQFLSSFADNVRLTDPKSDRITCTINTGDIVDLFDEEYEKTVIDTLEIKKRELDAITQQFKMQSNMKQPSSIGASTLAGAILAGPSGALVGYALGKDKNAKFERSLKYNEALSRERADAEKAINEIRLGNYPTKTVTINRSYFGLMTYAGTLPYYEELSFYTDVDKLDKLTLNQNESVDNLLSYDKIKEQQKVRNAFASIYLDNGTILPETAFVKNNIDRILMEKSVDKVVIEEFDNLNSLPYESYSENQCNEKIMYIRELQKLVIDNTEVINKGGYLIERIEKKINEIRQKEREEFYQQKVQSYSNANSIKIFENLKKDFEDMKGYKESEDYVQKCSKMIEHYRKLEEDEQLNLESERKKKFEKARINKIKMIAIGVSSVVLIIVIGLVITKIVKPNNIYNEAMALMNSGEYEKSITVFETLNGYKDASQQIDACNEKIIERDYNAAVEMMNNGKYEESITVFEALNGYKDASKQIDVCNERIIERDYNAAVEMINSGEYTESITIFEKLGDYKDSIKLIAKGKLALLQIASIGSYVQFGDYNGNTDWKVLAKEDDKILVVSKYAIENGPYNTKDTSITWGNCTLRGWLNGTYLTSAFSSDEQSRIMDTLIEDSDNNTDETDTGNNITDKVFLLSKDEVKKYANSDKNRQATLIDGTSVWWWLRTSGEYSNYAECVGTDGSVMNGNPVHATTGAVRPAMWIDISNN